MGREYDVRPIDLLILSQPSGDSQGLDSPEYAPRLTQEFLAMGKKEHSCCPWSSRVKCRNPGLAEAGCHYHESSSEPLGTGLLQCGQRLLLDRGRPNWCRHLSGKGCLWRVLPGTPINARRDSALGIRVEHRWAQVD